MNPRAFSHLVPFLTALLFIAGPGHADRNWRAAPIMAHEWGVSTFVWSRTGRHPAANLPSFFYTDERPGKPLAGTLDVRDFPKDHRTPELMARIRKYRSKDLAQKWYWKPLLYFYPHGDARSIPVGLAVDFPSGSAKAWYPQVDALRLPGMRPVAGGEKGQLIWRRLGLGKKPGKGFRPSDVLRENEKWVQDARDTDSAYVSNGSESEKFVFYEGASRETPFIALLPFGGPGGALANTGDFPIHDVFVIFRKGDRVWSTYSPFLPPVPARAKAVGKNPIGKKAGAGKDYEHAGPHATVLPLPDFRSPGLGREESRKAFAHRMGARLVEVLSGGDVIGGTTMHRNPRRPRSKSVSHYLYKKEAAGLERIWRDELFKNEGLTVIYREDPAYLDKIMPLRIYTDRAHYILLSRCGLVLNKQIPYKKIGRLHASLLKSGLTKEHRENRFLSLGLVEFMLRTGPSKKLREYKRVLANAK